MKAIYGAIFAAALAAATATGCATSASDRSVGQFASDAALTARVKTALIREDDVNANAINVNTFRGVVQLSGFVDNAQMIREAGDIARQVEGVQSVKNDIQVAPRR